MKLVGIMGLKPYKFGPFTPRANAAGQSYIFICHKVSPKLEASDTIPSSQTKSHLFK